jgi:hypothetical protein
MRDRAHSSWRLVGPYKLLHGEVNQAVMVHRDGCAELARIALVGQIARDVSFYYDT